MIRIKTNRGCRLILSMPILFLIMLTLFSSCARTMSKEDKASIQSVSINMDEKITWPLWDTRDVDLRKFNENAKGIFSLVDSRERPPKKAELSENRIWVVYGQKWKRIVGAYSRKIDDPVLYVFYLRNPLGENMTYPSLKVLRFVGPYANDPSLKEYWDTNKLEGGLCFEKMVKYVMKKENINALDLIREEFSRELKESGLFPSIVSEGGDAQIKLKATFFGFYSSGDLTRINILLSAEIIRTDGEKFWLGNAGRRPYSDDIPARRREEYLNNPDLILKDLKQTAQIVSAEIINKARGEE